MKINEILKESVDQAFQLGLDDARQGNPRGKSINPNITDRDTLAKYQAGWQQGKDEDDHAAWQEKIAAKRQGRHYHESVREGKRTEHKGYYGTDGTWFPNEEEYAASLKGDPNEEESKKKISESHMYARQNEEFFSNEDFEVEKEKLKALGGDRSRAARETYKPFGKLGKLTKPEQVIQHRLAGIPKHEWSFKAQYAEGSDSECRICGRVQRLNKKGRPINR